MTTIEIRNLSFSYSGYYRPVFRNVNLTLDSSWRLGLIGRNGRGKTTFLRLLAGELEPDRGEIHQDCLPRFFAPAVSWGQEMTALDVVKEQMGGLYTLERRLWHSDCREEAEYLHCLEQYEFHSGYTAESDIQRECHRMGIASRILSSQFGYLSGGEQSKLLIIAEMLRKDHFVLFDEPTNHLDAQGRKSVARYLSRKSGFIVVTHDREFLDGIADHILAINKCDIELEKGTYSTWEHNMRLKTEYELTTKKKLEGEIGRLEAEMDRKGSWADSLATQKYSFRTNSRSPDSREAKLRKAAKVSQRRMEKDIEVKKGLLKNYEVALPLRFEQQQLRGRSLLEVRSLSFSYGGYPVLRDVSFELEQGDRLWVLGANGSGKTTLFKLLSGALFGYDGVIRRHPSAVISYCAQSAASAEEALTGNPDPRRTSRIRDFLQDFSMDTGILERPPETWSSGELRKYHIACALASPNHILLLDEPLNYTDTFFAGQLEAAVLEVKPTLIFIDHDERFGQTVATKKLVLNP